MTNLESTTEAEFSTLGDKFRYFFDYKLGAMGGAIMGCGVWLSTFLSNGRDISSANRSGLVQAVYTFSMASFFSKMAVKLNEDNNRVVAVVVPTVLTTLIALGVHSLFNDPNPVMSVAPVLALSPLGYEYSIRHRANHPY